MNAPYEVKKIQEWITEHYKGNDTNYNRCKSDTDEAIDNLKDLYNFNCQKVEQLREWFYLNLRMYEKLDSTASENEGKSLYRSFLTLNNDCIVTLRIANHYSTNHSTTSSWKQKGKPDSEYHMVLNKQQHKAKLPITSTRNLNGVMIYVVDIELEEFNDEQYRKFILDELIRLLTNGVPPINESIKITSKNKILENMNTKRKQTIRLNESQLHQIIKESVQNVLNEKKERNLQDKSGNRNKRKLELLDTILNTCEHQLSYENFLYNVLKINNINALFANWDGWDKTYRLEDGGSLELEIEQMLKNCGFSKSYKRFAEAMQHLKEAKKLFEAASQDIRGNYPDEDDYDCYGDVYDSADRQREI